MYDIFDKIFRVGLIFITPILLISRIFAQPMGWAQPDTIIIDPPLDEPSIAVDSNGNWHIVYRQIISTPPVNTYLIKYTDGNTTTILDQKMWNSSTGEGGSVIKPSIATDASDGLHVVYRYWDVSSGEALLYTEKSGRAVILVHGITGSNASWGDLKTILEAEGHTVKYFSYPSSNINHWSVPLETLAERLNDSLATWNNELQINELGVDIIGHSMGGLISRYFIVHPNSFPFADNVNKLITLGTPNYGALAALLGNLIPGTDQGNQMQFGSEFLWDLHQTWLGTSIGTEVLSIVGTNDNYSDDHDGTVLIPSANLENLGHLKVYVPKSHSGSDGLANIIDESHPSYIAINTFLSGEEPQSNEENVSQFIEGMLILRLFDPNGVPVNVRTLLGFPQVFWNPRPTFDWPPPWPAGLGHGVNSNSGIYFATGVEANSYSINVTPVSGFGTITIDPVIINPRQTTVIADTVYPANQSSTQMIASGNPPPVIFDNTDMAMDFSSGPGGEVSVYRFDDNPPGTNFSTLPHYWDVISEIPNESFSVNVELNYDASEVLAAGLNESQLVVAFYDSLWHPLTTLVDTISNTVTISTTHFSLFGIGNFSHTFNEAVEIGWNLIGLPLNVVDNDYLSLFPNANPGTLFWFNGSYTSEDTMDLGKGYWLNFPASETTPITGILINSLTIDLMQGWNLIAGPSCDVALSDINDPNMIINPGTLFGFDGSYISSDTLKQGKGYWVNANAAGQITIDCNVSIPGQLVRNFKKSIDITQYSILKISDATGASQNLYFNVEQEDTLKNLLYILPPIPPSGVFDARFAGDFRITKRDEEIIYLQSSHYPLTVSAYNLPDGDYQYVVKKMVGKKETKSHILIEGKNIEIINSQVKVLKLSREKAVPFEFIVQQNFPNPFNPVTEIRYSLPEAIEVEIIIYNTLGQKVKTLISKKQEAGYHVVVWDGTNEAGLNVSSGIYMYRVKTGKHTAIKKMVLLK